jgi:ABC-type lipoprotein release transport system permease subunit
MGVKIMFFDLSLQFKYWKKNKKSAGIIILIFVLCIIFVFITFSMLITQYRRDYHENYFRNISTSDTDNQNYVYGGYNINIIGDEDKLYDILKSDEGRKMIKEYHTGDIYGKVGKYGYKYTIGSISGGDFQDYAGIQLIKGKMPSKADNYKTVNNIDIRSQSIEAYYHNNFSKMADYYYIDEDNDGLPFSSVSDEIGDRIFAWADFGCLC